VDGSLGLSAGVTCPGGILGVGIKGSVTAAGTFINTNAGAVHEPKFQGIGFETLMMRALEL